MCGIAGFVSKTVAPTAITQMLERLHHRGPDGRDSWSDNHITLGHTRLAIVDTSDAGRQPMHLGELHTVVNGEIYNYPELRADLEKRYGAKFASHCDSEVVLHGYAYEGEGFFARMNGMFGFALYDAKARKLMLVRDKAGIKPVYYCQHEGGLFFASEIKALLAPLNAQSWNIDQLGLSQYLSYQTTLAGRTLFEGVSLLLPGQMLTLSVDTNEVKLHYYSPLAKSSETITEFEQAVNAFSKTFDESIKRHLLSDVPLASYISAGMDSSSVAVAAAHALQGPMHAFTGRFPQETGWYDETSVAAEAVKSFNGVHHAIDITPQDFTTHFDAIIDALDEPKMGMGAFSQYMVAKHVAAKFKVVLTGHGGDELFAGYPLFKLTRLSTLRGLKASELPHVVYFILSALRKIFQPEFGRFLPVLWSRRAQAKLLNRSIDKNWLPLQQLQAPCANTGERIFETYMQEYLPNLLVVEDKLSMAHSLESRTPLLDHQMLALSRQIPMETKLHNGTLKAIIKSHARAHLPPIYFQQPKRGFPTPLRRWMRENNAELLKSRLLGENSALTHIISRNLIEKEVTNFTNSWKRYVRPLDEIQSHRMWQLLSLESWLRQWESRYGITLKLP